ncbi:uncharacterized protein LOC124422573 [Vespa crabro]|uniref:uncharacterized protein LOC124422573 n=1 Tax=Vespa crabro TaxID=7445 RepID=UPI001F02B8C4|nr:uncharacterized protein LOC124422573 [Vespa crabro]
MKLAIARRPNGARKLDRVSQSPWGNSATESGASKRVATSPPQLPDERLKKPRQEATSTDDIMWSEVANKRRNKEKSAKKPTKHPQEEEKEPSKSEDRPRKRTRPGAILLKPANGKSYVDVVGDIHQCFKTTAARVDARSVRQTRTGGVLLELKRTIADIRASLAETLRKVVGETSSITELVPRATLEIRDCDCCTFVVEVKEALKRTLPDYAGKLEVKSTNPNARQQHLALVRLKEEAAGKLLKAGRVLVGFVSCRVRRRTEVSRCYRCLDYGHYSASRKCPDSSKYCHFCDSTGHKIKDCKVSEPTCFLCSNSEDDPKKHLAGSKACKAFQEAHATANKRKTSEQYRDRAGIGWYADELGTAGIWIPDPRQIHVSDQGSGRGYVWVRHKSATYVSVYLTPNDRIDDFQTKLDDLEDALRERQGDLIVAGDLNAKALEWERRGLTSTFDWPGYRETIPDVSLANEQLVARVAGWQVNEDYTGSDHQYILFDIHDRRPAVTTPLAKDEKKWQRRPAYWWTNEIADLRKKCLSLRRVAQRAKRRDLDAAPLAAEYQAAKKSSQEGHQGKETSVLEGAVLGNRSKFVRIMVSDRHNRRERLARQLLA